MAKLGMLKVNNNYIKYQGGLYAFLDYQKGLDKSASMLYNYGTYTSKSLKGGM